MHPSSSPPPQSTHGSVRTIAGGRFWVPGRPRWPDVDTAAVRCRRSGFRGGVSGAGAARVEWGVGFALVRAQIAEATAEEQATVDDIVRNIHRKMHQERESSHQNWRNYNKSAQAPPPPKPTEPPSPKLRLTLLEQQDLTGNSLSEVCIWNARDIWASPAPCAWEPSMFCTFYAECGVPFR